MIQNKWLITTLMCQLALTSIGLSQDTPVAGRYLTDQTIGGARVDLDRVDLNLLKAKAIEWGVLDEDLDRQVLSGLPFARAFVNGLVNAGAEDLWVLIDLQAFNEPPTMLITVKPGPKQAEQVQGLMDALMLLASDDSVVLKSMGDHVLICSPTMEKFFEQLDTSGAAKRSLPASVIKESQQVVTAFYAPSPDQLRVMRETLPNKLPEPFGEVNVKRLLQNVELATVMVSIDPEIAIRTQMQTNSEENASEVRTELTDLAVTASQMPELKNEFPDIAALLADLPLKAEESSVVIEVSESNGQVAKLVEALAGPVKAARSAARRTQAMNNLKQIMLAHHNYYSVHDGFTLRASVDDEGKPLLSWRVHLLPYLEQQALYKQFHLDEPWDSDHNKALIEKMPLVFKSPGTPNLKPGLTNYVVAVAENTFLSTAEPMKFRQVVDGSSNTLAVLETDEDHAVIWTKPDDLAVDFQQPQKGLLLWSKKVFLGAIMDGSVQAITKDIDAKQMENLLRYNDGNVVNF